jgi:hypothetical protein
MPVFSSEREISQISKTSTDNPFIIKINIIRKQLVMIRKGKSVGLDCIPGEILKMGGEAMIPYLARLLDITINNGTIPRDWKKTTMVPICKGGRSFGGKKLQASQFNFSGVSANEACHSRIYKTSMGG